ncbi:btb (poz) domain-containing 2a-related [Anaeramoeba ignava]|uniref:Btb (Poz) domain-containing 2a-related n=1 Tax=Anaeramoeba ignava TaxID=1746090 RepID=A0A9Q0L927_ANAIG|nr:btb (poz) domain-containing 2a-related [Anaeramoeba ignava]
MNTLEQSLTKMLEEHQYADVKFVVGEAKTEIFAHRLILSVSSEFWMKMFFGLEWKEVTQKRVAEVVVPDFEPATFQQVLRFVYTREVVLDETNVLDIYRAADKYLITDLLDYCTRFVMHNISYDNCLQIFHFCQYFTKGDLYNQVCEFIEKRSNDLFRESDSLVNLEQDSIREILELKNLRIKEIDLFDKVVNWGKAKAQKEGGNPKDFLDELIPLIHLEVMTKDDLILLLGNEFIEQSQLTVLIKEKVYETVNFSSGRRGLCAKPPQELKTIIVASDDRDPYVSDLVESMKTNGIVVVDRFNGRSATPSLEKLLEYDVVVVYADYDWSSPTDVSNVLKQYVESGGGLLLFGAFALATNHPGKDLLGDITTGFIPLGKGEVRRDSNHTLGEFDHLHEIMKDVTSFDGGKSSFFVDTSEVNQGEVIARWENGIPLVTTKQPTATSGQIVVLNFFPMSTIGFSTGWLPSTHGRKLIANACDFVAQNSPNSMKL